MSGRLTVDIPAVIDSEDESGSFHAYEIVITAGADTWKVGRWKQIDVLVVLART